MLTRARFQRLVDNYMQTVQDTFPILGKKIFTDQFHKFYASAKQGKPLQPPDKWLSLLNLVFAISSSNSHLFEAEWRSNRESPYFYRRSYRTISVQDHSTYHSRAMVLGLRGAWWAAHPELTQMQILGLLALYYLSIGHINRFVTLPLTTEDSCWTLTFNPEHGAFQEPR